MKNSKSDPKPLWRVLLLLYCAAMVYLLFFRSSGWIEGLSYGEQLKMNTNLQPFFTIRNYLHAIRWSSSGELVRHCLINLAGNVLLFIPAGYLFPRIFGKLRKFFPFFLVCTGLILAVELLQLVTLLGSFDVDDLILNLFGMSLGFLLYRLTGK